MFGPHRGPLPPVKYHNETHKIKNSVMKQNLVMEQSKGPNGDLKPEHKKTTMSPIADIDSQALHHENIPI